MAPSCGASHQGRFHGRAVSRWESYCRESVQHFESDGFVCIYKSTVAHDHKHDFSFSHALQAQGDAAERKPGDKQQTTPWQRTRQNDDTPPSNKKSGDAGKPSGERPPKKARSAAEAKEQPCRHFLKGSCKFGADCKFSHDQQPQNPASKATAAKAGQTSRPKTAPSANKFTENGKAWIRDRKDGKFYEYSQCAFCLAPAGAHKGKLP